LPQSGLESCRNLMRFAASRDFSKRLVHPAFTAKDGTSGSSQTLSLRTKRAGNDLMGRSMETALSIKGS
jgi:hypothetical protein